MTSTFVLFAHFDPNPDPIPPEIWVCSDQAAAENLLRSWSESFLGGYTHDCNGLPPDALLVAAFRAAGAHVHLFECQCDGGGGDEQAHNTFYQGYVKHLPAVPLDTPLERGKVHHVVIQHDDWCAFYSGAECNCKPTVSRHIEPERS